MNIIPAFHRLNLLGIFRRLRWQQYKITCATLTIGSFICLNGCFSTTLSHRQWSEISEGRDVTSLKPLSLKVRPTSQTPRLLGFQYAFFIFPLGRVYDQDSSKALENALRFEAALRGYRIEDQDSNVSVVTLEDMSLNAYDVLAFRRLSCNVTVLVVSADGSLPPQRYSVHTARWNTRGFAPELESLSLRCLQEVASKVLDHHVLAWRGPS